MNGLHGIIFAYERRGDLQELGSIRSSASIPFGGRFRAVDFALSNLVNANVTDVGIVLHGQYQSLLDHLGTGKDWDLSRKRGGLRLLPPFNYQQDWGAMPYRGHIEALHGVRSYLEGIRQDYVVMMDGDLVANLPIADVYENHVKSGADITVVCDPSKLDDVGCKGAPDLVMEILSPSTQRHDKLTKFNLYQRAGIREYWIVDPASKSVQVFVLEDGHYAAADFGMAGDRLKVNVLEDCTIDLTSVFAE